jgi:uncharacterized membrane protein
VYQLLLFVHVVCAMIWVGGALYAQVLALRVRESDDPAELPRLARHVEFIGSRVFMPVAILLFLAGAAMTVQAWSFGQAWIAISVALWIASALAGALYLAPRAKRVVALFEDEGPSSVAGRAVLDQMFLVSRLELGAFAIIVALMVFKPGA